MPGLSRALEPAQGSKVASGGFCFYLSQRRSVFWTLKTRKTREVNMGLRSSTIWKPGGLVGMPPDAKLPSSHIPLAMRQRLGYLTATSAW